MENPPKIITRLIYGMHASILLPSESTVKRTRHLLCNEEMSDFLAKCLASCMLNKGTIFQPRKHPLKVLHITSQVARLNGIRVSGIPIREERINLLQHSFILCMTADKFNFKPPRTLPSFQDGCPNDVLDPNTTVTPPLALWM